MLLEFLLLAQASVSVTATQAPLQSAADQKVVCHFENVGQSRIAQRICHTKAEWAQIERQAEDDFSSDTRKFNNPGNPVSAAGDAKGR